MISLLWDFKLLVSATNGNVVKENYSNCSVHKRSQIKANKSNAEVRVFARYIAVGQHSSNGNENL